MLGRLRSGSDTSMESSPDVDKEHNSRSYLPILWVLFLEFLALSLAKGLIPSLLVETFGNYTYTVVGIVETVKGLLAFLSCPAFGRLSDRIGRKPCLLVTVVGTTLPLCALFFTKSMHLHAMLLSVSGLFSATFPLTFAYISDCVDKQHRAPAYGLALATFGLSFTLGPITGSYLATSFGSNSVFAMVCLLVSVNVAYIFMYLPETVTPSNTDTVDAAMSPMPMRSRVQQVFSYLPNTWDVSATFRVFGSNPFMSNLSLVVFLYYTAVWAIVSTLMVYVTRHLQFDPVTLGWLLSGYGMATMFSEGVLVRVLVPVLGELNAMRLGLFAFACQCVVVAFSNTSTMIFVSMLFSMVANLVYPSVSSLVSKVVDNNLQGEALGALNGIKALTEGFGPLVFGLFMSLFEKHPLPGAPYLVASVLSLWALLHSYELPAEPELITAKSVGGGDAEGLLSDIGDDLDDEN